MDNTKYCKECQKDTWDSNGFDNGICDECYDKRIERHERVIKAVFAILMLSLAVAMLYIAFNYAHYNDTQALSDNTTQQHD